MRKKASGRTFSSLSPRSLFYSFPHKYSWSTYFRSGTGLGTGDQNRHVFWPRKGKRDEEVGMEVPVYPMAIPSFLVLGLIDGWGFFSANHRYHTPCTEGWARDTCLGPWLIKRSFQRASLERFSSLIQREVHEEKSLFAASSLPSCLRRCSERTWHLEWRQPYCYHDARSCQNSKDGRTERRAEHGSSMTSKGDLAEGSARM